MGCMLEAPHEGDWDQTVHREYFALIKNKGFDTVRIPICWPMHATRTSPYTIDPIFFQRVDTVIEWALEQKLNVIINIHNYPEMMADPQAEKTRFFALWGQIANRYKNLPETVYFELLNEPTQNIFFPDWNEINTDTIHAIRSIDTIHTIIITGINWSNASGLNGLEIPKGESKIMVTFHMYSPSSFTHQGASWVTPVHPTGIHWPGKDVELACRIIQIELDFAKNWSDNHPGIPILLGEFGAYNKGDMVSRANWTAYIRKQAEIRGFSWTYWEFCSDFGVYSNNTGQWFEPLVVALGLKP
jgi:endoglucanase